MPDKITQNFELFAPGACHQPLPLNELVDTFRFSKFVGITYEIDGNYKQAVIPRSSLFNGYAKFLASQNKNATVLDLEGGLPLGDDPLSPRLKEPLSRSVPVESVEALVADPSLIIDGQSYALKLNRAAISNPRITPITQIQA